MLLVGPAGCGSSRSVDEADVVNTALPAALVDPIGWPNWRGPGMTGVALGDVADSRVVWRHDRGGPYIPSGLILDGRPFLLGDGGNLAAYNAADGAEVWKDRLRGSFTASLVAADGRIFAVDEEGTLSVFRAGDRFESLARIAMDERVLAAPAVAGGAMFLRTESRLYCMPAEDRKE